MITANSKIKIVPSPQLSQMMLDELAGRTGIVTEDLTDPERRNKGYMVQLDEFFQQEYQWFIPQESAVDA